LHLYPIQIDTKKTNKNRSKIFDALRLNNIGVNVHYIPVHMQPYYEKMGFEFGDFPTAESYYSNTISLPMFSKLSFNSQDMIISTLQKVLC
jgi:dTDP-4-amino-4,6-dideoxygalactose transaminase